MVKVDRGGDVQCETDDVELGGNQTVPRQM